MRRRHFHEDEAEINITPMLDVVFIMLIFFIVTTSFVKETGVSVNRPQASTAQKVEKGNILIAIKDNGQIWINKREVDIRAVRAVVEKMHAENPEGSAVIIADKGSRTGDLVTVMDQIKAAKVEKISIAATKTE
ncbi:MAG TPA: biopolymer transporter ExbD [Gammaproteobacteria bacterium]|jgi:biopolymer transport protein ExbD|nr:biopolymer transporter ExbD [Xanthomonadales bacterium]MCB1603993.1 biopolymer transporter ExbD [Xanthomonadales bacterium]HOP22721.1 biopolymer transporter ExbD [Gammaproteobacteria bacterium]HPI96434.1 biopolymer transporter ExbD [Gammaproteobacteria bacterium]HPQ87926.1 biopolymer transporter ExbD [Gammaproteobacteria bacterium]